MAFWLLQGCSLELGLNLTMQDPGIWHPAPAKFRDFMGTLAAPGMIPRFSTSVNAARRGFAHVARVCGGKVGQLDHGSTNPWLPVMFLSQLSA